MTTVKEEDVHFFEQRVANSVVTVATRTGEAHFKVGLGVMMCDRNAPAHVVDHFLQNQPRLELEPGHGKAGV